MIDFSAAKAITIPEGSVKRILSGDNVLWSKNSYQLLEYIETNGTQYIDTGIFCDQDTKIEMIFTREETSARYLFGVASSDNKASFTGYQSGVNSGSWRFGGAYARPKVVENTKITFTMDKSGIILGGNQYNYVGTVGTFATPQTLVLGGCNSPEGAVGNVRHIGKLYGFKLWQSDVLVANYIPCTNLKGIAGFWDNVSKQFRQLEVLPSGYTRLDYIETTGEQYINTGVVPSPNSRVICDFQATDKDSENHIFGSRQSSSSRAFAFSIRGTGTWRFGYGSGYTGSKVADTNRHTVDVNKNVCTLDGSVLYTKDYEEFTGAYTIYIGAVKASGIYEGRAKIYSCQIYDNDTLLRDYVPCINADGEIGMWDKVNNVFYGNAGTGTFVIPT
jgi:hypothetical protein